MTDLATLHHWLSTLHPSSSVAVDDGGLALVELDGTTCAPTGATFEIGGVPEEETCPDCNARCTGPVPPYCRKHHGDYMTFLALHNCD